jgi:ABC-type Fe3+/spermidine/putrescine transport system ATPase subunit
VAKFLGYKNILDGNITDSGGIETDIGPLHPSIRKFTVKDKVTVVIPTDAVRVHEDEKPDDKRPMIHGKVVSRLFTGQNYRFTVAVDEGPLIVGDLQNKKRPPDTGDRVSLWLNPEKMIIIPAER